MPRKKDIFALQALEPRVLLSGEVLMQGGGAPEAVTSEFQSEAAAIEIQEVFQGAESREEIASDDPFAGVTTFELFDGPKAESSELTALGMPGDPPDGATITVNSELDTNARDEKITLREAILLSNGNLTRESLSEPEKGQVSGEPVSGARETIRFNIGGGGNQVITVGGSGLPFITDPVVIDGTTQPGFNPDTHMPLIEINASNAGSNQLGFLAAGLEITAGNSVVKGLVINRAPGDGIRIRNFGWTRILGNFIGTDSTGTNGEGFGNGGNAGIQIINSADNRIGGGNPGEGNLISGNRHTGIVIGGSALSTGNWVQGNLIGTDISGLSPPDKKLGNGHDGILLTGFVGATNFASDNLIGGSEPEEGNVISGNRGSGIVVVQGARNRILGNLIGTTEDGLERLGNTLGGVLIVDAPDTTVGGVGLWEANVISANTGHGIKIAGSNAQGTKVLGNFIGTDLNGAMDLGNTGDGIFLGEYVEPEDILPDSVPISGVAGAPSDTTIGGDTPAARNIISGNDRDGVRIAQGAKRTAVKGNFIGLTQEGNVPRGNTGDGVAIYDSPDNTIGGVVDGQVVPRNVISANEESGVLIKGGGSTNNNVLGNYIGTERTGERGIITSPEVIFFGNTHGVVIEDAGAIELNGAVIQAGNMIGSSVPGGRNVISGNLFAGVAIVGDSHRNTVQGNYIGTNQAGDSAAANKYGVLVRNKEGIPEVPSHNIIGGQTLAARNVISGNDEDGIHIAWGPFQNKIWGNIIGLKANATEPLGNGRHGVAIFGASDNDVGGSAPKPGEPLGNIISGNGTGDGPDDGVHIEAAGERMLSDPGFTFSQPANNNRVRGNIIGLDVTGLLEIRNAGNGVGISGGRENRIGGTIQFERNIISSNLLSGVSIVDAAENNVLGNFIGTDLTGKLPRPNVRGIHLGLADGNFIGGVLQGARNIISGNGEHGIIVGTGDENIVQGNYIGTDVTGNGPLPNGDGVMLGGLARSTIIGGLTESARNVISGNLKSGVRIENGDPSEFSSVRGNFVRGNFIGVGENGTSQVGNGHHGIFIEKGSFNEIGGTEAGAENVIAFNGQTLGVKGHGVVVASGTENRISRNSIYQNSGRGIDLGNDSFTLNDVGDTDLGPNNVQDFPTVTSVRFVAGQKLIVWELDSTPNTDFTIEFFSNKEPDPSGFGEGERFLKSTTVSTDDEGYAEFPVFFLDTDSFISATATDEDDNTSEFSLVDTDGDSLADAWEVVGGFIDLNEDGTPDFTFDFSNNSQGLAIDPERKDIFVEVDAMAGLAPDPSVLAWVEAAFAAVPATLANNPGNLPGIALHAQLDETGLPNQPFPLTDELNTWPEFEVFKALFFGSPNADERGNANWSANGRAAKGLVYRYNIFAGSFADGTGLGEMMLKDLGNGEFKGLGGNDFIVALGDWPRGQLPGPDGTLGTQDDIIVYGGTDAEQAGLFMHELGHTLGLFHGGGQADGSFNFKPNYHSVMNYLWTVPADWMFEDPNFDGIQNFNDLNGNGIKDGAEPFVEFDRNGNGWNPTDTTWELIYSERDFGTLDENNLTEISGIGGHPGHWLPGPDINTIISEAGGVDWNNNNNPGEFGVAANINAGFPDHPFHSPSGQVLHGFEDWSHLRFYFRELPNMNPGVHVSLLPSVGSAELTLEEHEALNAAGDGPGVLSLSRTNSFSVDEGNGFATILIVRSAGTVGEVSVDFGTADDSAVTGTDYLAATGMVTFAPGEFRKTITVPVLNDVAGENRKHFQLVLSNPKGGATLGRIKAAAIAITDDDGAGQFEFANPFFLVNETETTATIEVTRTGGTAGAVSVQFTTGDASATADQDYTATSGMLDFAEGEGSKTFTIAILDDATIEGIQSLNLILSNPTGGATLGTSSEASLLINDVERGSLQFSEVNMAVSENGAIATFTVIRPNGQQGEVAVTFSTSNGSATDGLDFTAATGVLTFADGVSIQTFTVAILNDTLTEITETFQVTLSNPTAGAMLGSASAVQISILDDEPAALQFEAGLFEAIENSSAAAIRVIRSGRLDQIAAAQFGIVDGTARTGLDFVAETGTVVLLEGKTSQTFTVTLMDNKLGDGARTLQLVLSNPAEGSALGTPNSATLRIIDDETVNGATFVVTNTNNSGPGSLHQAILDANARSGTDFIHFNIAGAGVRTIRPTAAIPAITDPVTIDGYTQPGASTNTLEFGDNAVLLIELDGSGLVFPAQGLLISAGDSIVRGLVINRFSAGGGIFLDNKEGNLIEGNFLGTDATGKIARGNGTGVQIGEFFLTSSNNLIGGTTPASRNVISGNSTGVGISSESRVNHSLKPRGNRILGNYIGVAADGISPLGNNTGIAIDTNDSGVSGKQPLGNTVGGVEPGAANIIAFNRADGVIIFSGYGNSVRGNSIYSNNASGDLAVLGQGINLAHAGELNNFTSNPIAVNDPRDADTGDRIQFFNPGFPRLEFPGPNALQNFPVLSSALSSSGTLTVEGRLESTPGTTFQIDFYANDQMDLTGYGPGKTYLGTIAIRTDIKGFAKFSAAFPVSVPNGHFISATATDSSNNTSEFSARIKVGDALGGAIVVNTTDDLDDGVADAQHTSLREAIHEANNRPGMDTITFNIPGTGVQTIRPRFSLPPVSDAITMDGYTQPGAQPNTQTIGFNGVLLIEITGATPGNPSTANLGLRITGGYSTVRGLVINRLERPIFIQGPGQNVIEGNILGLDPTGNSILQPFSSFFTTTISSSSENFIGGSTPAARNLLSGLLLDFNANGNRVQGNYIGTRGDGLTKALGNTAVGLRIDSSSNNLIARNVISGGNSFIGITITSASVRNGTSSPPANFNRILGNFIGVGADGVTPLGNQGRGVTLRGDANGNLIGGIEPGAGNIIARNDWAGVFLEQTQDPTLALRVPEGNAIRGNSIFANGFTGESENAGIDLRGDIYSNSFFSPVSRNDSKELASGPNELQNFPVLSSAMSSNGTITIQGKLHSTPSGKFEIDFYSNEQLELTGYGPGKSYLGTTVATTDAAGDADFTATFSVSVPNGHFITATATNQDNNTSEFSARLTVGDILGSILIVNTLDDVDDGVADAQHTSLREAIHAANNHPGHDTITFNIPGEGVRTIFQFRQLPPISDSVTIDGYTQPGASPNTLAEGNNAVLLIELIGAPGAQVGLDLRAGNSLIRGLVINRFGDSIFIADGGGNTIAGNFFGTDAAGLALAGGLGLRIFASSDNLIGGTTPEARNLISGSQIRISGGSGPAIIPNPAAFYVASGNVLQGNYIGTDSHGTALLGANGLFISGSFNSLIGGTTPEARNIIVGGVSLGGHPVQGTPANNVLRGNYIGTDRTGKIALGISPVGISGTGNIVGGTMPGAGNILASGLSINNDSTGTTSGGHVVQGNRIGTDKDGLYSLGSTRGGVGIFSFSNVIGGIEPGAGNLISGNGGNGISLDGIRPTFPIPFGNLIQGNLIGTQGDGVSPLPNLGDGIVIHPTFEDTISGFVITGPGAANSTIEGNTIAFNRGNGINLLGGSATAGTRIAILSNSIYSNGKLGIDLKGDGPTPNDSGDGDLGDNNLQNFPALTSITNSGDSITIQGTLNSNPNGTYRLEFFENIAFDSSNFGEGQRFIGMTNVTTDASGNASFNVTLPVAVPVDYVITSTATDAQKNTSEFSGRHPDATPGETANLSLAISDIPDPVLAGQLLTYTLNITNHGPDTATRVVLFDTLPANVKFDSATLSQGSFGLIGTTVYANVGSLPSGATATVQIHVVPSAAADITNTAAVASDQFDTDVSNNNTSATTTVLPAADLSVTKSSDPTGPVAVGNSVLFIITVTNNGPSPATAVRVTDTLPESLSFAFFSNVDGVHSNGIVSWDLGTVFPGTTVTRFFHANIDGPGTHTNRVEVASGVADTHLANNTATLDITSVPSADLALIQTATPNPVAIGERLTYTFTIRNNGPSAASGVVLTDTLPANVTFDSTSSTQGTFAINDGLVTFDIGVLASGAEASAQIVVIPTLGGILLRSTATVTANGAVDQNPFDNETTVETIVSARYPAVLYGAAPGPGGGTLLYAIDPATGTAGPIGPLGFNRVSAMDFHASTGILYATGENPNTGQSVLITIDPRTGAGTEVGPTNIHLINSSSSITDISFRPSDGALFAFLNNSRILAVIDTTTGQASAVGNTAMSGSGNALAFSPEGTLFHANHANLSALNPATGAATLVAPLGFSAPADDSPRLNAMDFDPVTGQMFASVNEGFRKNYLATVNLATGAVTILGASIEGLDAVTFFVGTNVNTAPVAIDDSYTTNEDTPLILAAPQGVLANDSDPDGDNLIAILVTGPAHGTLALTSSGSFTYTPSANFFGNDSFVYKANDEASDSNNSTVAIVISTVNDAPIGASKSITISAEETYVFSVVDFGFSDPNDDPINTLVAVKITTLPTAGSFNLDGTSVAVGEFVSAAAIDSGELVFGPEGEAAGNPYSSFTFQVQDNGGTINGGIDLDAQPKTITINIDSGNSTPVLTDVHVTPTVDEGGTVHLAGSFTDIDASDAHVLRIDWGEGSPETMALGPGVTTFSVSHRYLDDNPTGTPVDVYSVGILLIDLQGASAAASLTTTVKNVAPVGELAALPSGVRGQTLLFTATVADPGILDTHEVAFDFGDGTVVQFHSPNEPSALAPTHVYRASGTYTVTFTVRDDDGAASTVTKEITIQAAEIQADPCDPTQTALMVGGTAEDDKIRIVLHGKKDEIKVLLNGESLGVFTPTGRIIVFGQAGDDDLEVAGSIDLAASLFGGTGHDRLKAGSGPSILLGGDGDDHLNGGNGRSILIGGNGADRIVGGPESDILIAGATVFDNDHHALCEILQTWIRLDLSYSERVEQLSTGPHPLNSSMVFDDGTQIDRTDDEENLESGRDDDDHHHLSIAQDFLTGSAGDDWFFASSEDKLTDRKESEIFTRISSPRN